jgi:hypothetical protein
MNASYYKHIWPTYSYLHPPVCNMPPPKRRKAVNIANLNGGSSDRSLKRQKTAGNRDLGYFENDNEKENVCIYIPITMVLQWSNLSPGMSYI